MRRLLNRGLRSLGCGLAVVVLVVAATAVPAAAAVPAQFGISFVPDGDPGQCGGPTQQWVNSPDWSVPIRLDTDGRSGGCQLAFGIADPGGAVTGLVLTYQLSPSSGADAGQCGPNQGISFAAAIPFALFGQSVRMDSDGRAGWCNLTFQLFGRSDVAVDVQFSGDGNVDQCKFGPPPGQVRTVSAGSGPLTLGLDMDSRPGGCNLAMRLRQG